MSTIRAMPILEVSDVLASVAFYERLGFASHGTWGEPPMFCIVQRGDVTLGLKKPEAREPVQNEWWSAYIYVSDAGALHAELKSAGITVTDLEDREYGLREFEIKDPDGHGVAFASDLVVSAFGPGLGAERGGG